jgi:hypothetical protein
MQAVAVIVIWQEMAATHGNTAGGPLTHNLESWDFTNYIDQPLITWSTSSISNLLHGRFVDIVVGGNRSIASVNVDLKEPSLCEDLAEARCPA